MSRLDAYRALRGVADRQPLDDPDRIVVLAVMDTIWYALSEADHRALAEERDR